MKRMFIMNLDNPGLDTIAMAEYMSGNCVVANSLVALSGTGELER